MWLLLYSPRGWAVLEGSGEESTRQDGIPDVFIHFDVEEKPAYAILVEKTSQQLHVYSYDGAYERILRFESSTGEAAGPKAASGDKKTPEGIYLFTKMHEEQDLSPTYGTRAYPTDYPNVIDRIAGRTGSAIWMHGTNRPLKPRDSNGCIVLENQSIDRLVPYISLNRTPIVIVDKISYSPRTIADEAATEILSFVSAWTEALAADTYHGYLAFYDASYLPEVSWWPVWDRARKAIVTDEQPMSIQTKSTSIVRINSDYVVWFDQMVRLGGMDRFSGTRKLFLRRNSDQLRIVGDEYMDLASVSKGPASEYPVVAAIGELKDAAERGKEKEIPDFVERWRQAWSTKNLKVYGSCYAQDFRSKGGGDLAAWLRYKERLNRRYTTIKVTISGLKVDTEGNRATAVFTQNYRSSGYRSLSRKKLLLIRVGVEWKIYREQSVEM